MKYFLLTLFTALFYLSYAQTRQSWLSVGVHGLYFPSNKPSCSVFSPWTLDYTLKKENSFLRFSTYYLNTIGYRILGNHFWYNTVYQNFNVGKVGDILQREYIEVSFQRGILIVKNKTNGKFFFTYGGALRYSYEARVIAVMPNDIIIEHPFFFSVGPNLGLEYNTCLWKRFVLYSNVGYQGHIFRTRSQVYTNVKVGFLLSKKD